MQNICMSVVIANYGQNTYENHGWCVGGMKVTRFACIYLMVQGLSQHARYHLYYMVYVCPRVNIPYMLYPHLPLQHCFVYP